MKTKQFSGGSELLKFLKNSQPVDKIGTYKFNSFEANMKTFFGKLESAVAELNGKLDYKLTYVDASEGLVPMYIEASIDNLGPEKTSFKYIFYKEGKTSAWPAQLKQAEASLEEEKKLDTLTTEVEKKWPAFTKTFNEGIKKFRDTMADMKGDCQKIESMLTYSTKLSDGDKKKIVKTVADFRNQNANLKSLDSDLQTSLKESTDLYKRLEDLQPQNEFVGDTDNWSRELANLRKDYANLAKFIKTVGDQAKVEFKS